MNKPLAADVEIYRAFQKSPIFFIGKVWGLVPQPLKPEYAQFARLSPLQDYEADWFEPFVKGKHITWQQWVFFLAFEAALRGETPRKIAIESGVGTGKSSSLAMLILWFLFCFKDAQVPCTAPTGDQMYNALWKETALWLGRMPAAMQDLFEWSSQYIRIKERAETWYARARTASKDKPEALAGVHGDFVLAIIDEASGVMDEVFQKGEGVLAGAFVFVVMISQHTRLIGYFHDAFNSDKENWVNLSFNSEFSPIVDRQFVSRIIERDGVDSDRYRVEVQGKSPKADAVDDQGFVPLLKDEEIREAGDNVFAKPRRLGVDPAGEGKDETTWVLRDRFKAKVVAIEKISTPKSIAAKTLTLALHYEVKDEDIFIDNFGVGADVAVEMAAVGHKPSPINVGREPDEENKKVYINKRAEAYWALRNWLRSGGEVCEREKFLKQLLSIRYRRELRDGIKIMSKEEMRKRGIPSPDRADGLMLTFTNSAPLQQDFAEETVEERFDRFAIT